MTSQLAVRHVEGDQFAIDIRGHTVVVDQPADVGGHDEGPTPTELFVAGLASCVAHYARRYLARHDLATEGLAVSVSYNLGGRPTRVTDIIVSLTPPPSLPAERRAAFFAVASGCTVHHTLEQPTPVVIVLVDAAPQS